MRNLLIGFVLFLIIGNLVIFGAFKWMSTTDANYSLPPLPGIKNLAKVDAHLWRGSAPSEAGYAALARKDVKVIVDLRAEDLEVDRAGIEALGMKLVRIPMRDGQAPTDEQVQKFMSVMKNADGRVYVHCGAGVGRTGTMAASYLVLSGRTSGMEALQRNLAVGPPSLEQIAFAAGLDEGEEASSVTPLTIVSRVLDAPRRLLVRVRSSYQ
jgi:protein-tyrosine phosphatase